METLDFKKSPAFCDQLTRANVRHDHAMPTVLRIGPYRFHFYSREPGEPPHIHVARDDFEAKFWLRPVRLAVNHSGDSDSTGAITGNLLGASASVLTCLGVYGSVRSALAQRRTEMGLLRALGMTRLQILVWC